METLYSHPKRKLIWLLPAGLHPGVKFSICLSSYFPSRLPKLQSRYLLLFPPNQKALVSCPTANKVSTQAPSLKPSPTASSPRLLRAAALSRPHRARHSPYPPSRTLHLQPQYGRSPQSCPPPKTPALVSPRP